MSVEIDGESGYEGFIDSLPRTGIDRLKLRGATISTGVIASIEKLKTLRQVILVDCRVAEIDPSKLAGSPALQELSIRGTDSEKQWRGLMPWLIKCPAIQILFGGNPMNVSDLKGWSHHTAPVFLSVNLDNNAGNVLDELENFPGLVGLELTISDDVSSSELARVGTLKSVELIVLNDGLLNADLVAVLARLPRLKVLRIQGSTKIGDFLSGGFPLECILAASFTRSLEPSLNNRFVDVCLALRSLRELPALENATAAQLRKLASRNQYTRFSVYGLDGSNAPQQLQIQVAEVVFFSTNQLKSKAGWSMPLVRATKTRKSHRCLRYGSNTDLEFVRCRGEKLPSDQSLARGAHGGIWYAASAFFFTPTNPTNRQEI